MPIDPAPRYLLILGCSSRKRHDSGLLPALTRYDGVNYRVLGRARREGRLPNNLDILIISAEYGVLAPDDLIPDDDRLMTPARARELQPTVSAELDSRLADTTYAGVFVNLGTTYLLTVEGSGRFRALSNVTYAEGGIGQKMGHMKRWLYAISEVRLV